jgi:hypothetical protein
LAIPLIRPFATCEVVEALGHDQAVENCFACKDPGFSLMEVVASKAPK